MAQRFILIIKNIIFRVNLKEKTNAIERIVALFTFLWEFLIVFSRVIIVYYSIKMNLWGN